MYITVVAMASLLVMSFNLNTNMNSSMNAYASIFENIQNADDIGQSLECVIVVVGCDGTGSVGSSGDTIIGSNNGNSPPSPPSPPEPPTCEGCFDVLSPEQLNAFLTGMAQTFPNDFPNGATLELMCNLMESFPPENQQIAISQISQVLSEASVPIDQDTITQIIECLQEVFGPQTEGESLKSDITSSAGNSFGFN